MDEELSKSEALALALRKARQRSEPMYVVWSGSGHAVASEEDLDTWWLGATVIAEVHEDGVCMDAN